MSNPLLSRPQAPSSSQSPPTPASLTNTAVAKFESLEPRLLLSVAAGATEELAEPPFVASPAVQADPYDDGVEAQSLGLELQETSSPPRVIASDYATLQDAIDALPGKHGEVYLPVGDYLVTTPLDLTYPGGYGYGIKFIGAGAGSRIIAATAGETLMDLTGHNHFYMRDLTITTDGVAQEDLPNTAILLARRADGWASQEHRFSNVRIEGEYTISNVYSITSELDRFYDCTFVNSYPGAYNFVWSQINFAGVTSPYQGAIRTYFSTSELRMSGCSFYNYGGAGSTNVYLQGWAMDLCLRDSYLQPAADGYAVYMLPSDPVSQTGEGLHGGEFDSLQIVGDDADDLFHIEGDVANVVIRNCSMRYGEAQALDAEELSYLVFENNELRNVRGWKTAIEVDELRDSIVTNNAYIFDNEGGQNPQGGPEIVLTGTSSIRNTFQAPDADMVNFTSLDGTTIDAVDDNGGQRRQYLGTFATGATLNLTPTDTAAMAGMVAGDIALDDGTNTPNGQVGLAAYDGVRWVYMGAEAAGGGGGGMLYAGQSASAELFDVSEAPAGAGDVPAAEDASQEMLVEELSNGSGPRVIATDYPTLQDAIDALPNREGEVYIPVGDYVITQTLDLTSSSAPTGGIKLIGAGRRTRIVPETNGQPAIDMTGAGSSVIRDLVIEINNAAVAPNIGVLLGRVDDPAGWPAQEHHFINVVFSGDYTLANIYSCGSQLNRFEGCIFINTCPASSNLVFTSENYAGVSSPYQGALADFEDNNELRVEGCTFYNWGGGVAGTNVRIRGSASDVTFRDCYLNPPEDGYGFQLEPSSLGGTAQQTHVIGCRFEAASGAGAEHVFHVEGQARNLVMRASDVIFAEGLLVNADAVDTFVLEDNQIWNIAGWKTMMDMDELSNSRIENNRWIFTNWGYSNPQPGPEIVLTGIDCDDSILQVPRADMIDCTTLTGTFIDALEDNGTRRQYLGDATTGVVLNLTPVDSAALSGMVAGDVALDDGTNTADGQVGLAVYDGAEWVFVGVGTPVSVGGGEAMTMQESSLGFGADLSQDAATTSQTWLPEASNTGEGLLVGETALVDGDERVIATDFATLQEAIDSLTNGTGEVYMPAGTYVLTQTLDLTDTQHLKLVGAGRSTIIVPNTNGAPAIDLTGATGALLHDFYIEAEGTSFNPALAPNVGILMGRSSPAVHSGDHTLVNVGVLGQYALAGLYGVGVSHVYVDSSEFGCSAPGSHNVYWAGANVEAVSSPYAGLLPAGQTTDLRMRRCTYENTGGGSGGSNVKLRGLVENTTIRDGYWLAPSGGFGLDSGADGSGNTPQYLQISNIRAEAQDCVDVLRIRDKLDVLTIRECTLIFGEGLALNADDVATLTFQNNEIHNVMGWKTGLEFDSLAGGRIRDNCYTFEHLFGSNPQAGPEIAVRVTTAATDSHIQVPQAGMLDAAGLAGTSVDILDDAGGVRRSYLGGGSTGIVTNLAAEDISAITGMIAGDLALDDGSWSPSGDVALMYYDGSGWIAFDGSSPPTVDIQASDSSASEVGPDTGTFTITRTGTTVGNLDVLYSLTASTADPADYTPTLSGSVTIPDGTSSVDVTITPVTDGLREGTEFVVMTLVTSAGYTIDPVDSTADVVIHDADATRGDADLDGDVDNVDFGALYGGFTGPGDFGKTWAEGDFDGDGDVDNVDFGALYGNFTGPLAMADTSGDPGDRSAASVDETQVDIVSVPSAEQVRQERRETRRDRRAARKEARQLRTQQRAIQRKLSKLTRAARRKARHSDDELAVDLLADAQPVKE